MPVTAAPPSAYNSPGMQRVPRPSSVMTPPAPARPGSTLQWRSSPHAAVPNQAAPSPMAEPIVRQFAGPIARSTGQSAQNAAPMHRSVTPSPVPLSTIAASPIAASPTSMSTLAQAPMVAPESIDSPTIRRDRGVAGPRGPVVHHVAYNHDHDASQMRRTAGQPVTVAQFELPAPAGSDKPVDASENELRSLFDIPSSPRPTPLRSATPEKAPMRNQTSPSSGEDLISPLGEMLRESSPRSPSDSGFEALPAPDEFENPFEDLSPRQRRDRQNTDGDRDDLLGLGDASFDDEDSFDMDDEPDQEDQSLTCEQFRFRIAKQTIDLVSLDISPPYRPDEINLTKYEKLKARFDASQPTRTFRNIAGAPLATGRFRDIAYGQVVLENDRGEVRFDLNELSEGDLAYITEEFGLPNECLLTQQPMTPRNWSPLSFTWKASNLCHNPLYFEDVNLERYGHSHGPIAEPLIQTAHFFGSVLVLPYKMGVHHPRECIYTLGYYRPGNCAPWILPPVPISARGILNQAAVMTAGTLLIP